jgi:hypothetical protein
MNDRIQHAAQFKEKFLGRDKNLSPLSGHTKVLPTCSRQHFEGRSEIRSNRAGRNFLAALAHFA